MGYALNARERRWEDPARSASKIIRLVCARGAPDHVNIVYFCMGERLQLERETENSVV